MSSLAGASFENEFWNQLPHDAEGPQLQPRQVPNVCASAAQLQPASSPRMLAWSTDLGDDFGLTEPDGAEAEQAARILSGSELALGSQPYAMRYGGHQFGQWAGQLGDGRVTNLGELRDRQGQAHTIQLKGAGRTPYSRGADGRAVLRSSLREFVLSEAMHHLGVPSSRALALVSSGDQVERDMFYDGHPTLEPGAIVTRVAPSFVRLGNFEIHASLQENDALKALADYCIAAHWPGLQGRYVEWYADICRRNARMVARWMALGFVHGVLNTDNTSILGLSIDYGPFGWLEPFEPDWTPNTTDAQGRRYAYGRQPQMIQWNLGCFGGALLPLGLQQDELQEAMAVFHPEYNQAFRQEMAAKLGLNEIAADDDEWLNSLFALMAELACDWSLFWRGLASVVGAEDAMGELLLLLSSTAYSADAMSAEQGARAEQWAQGWQQRLQMGGQPVAVIATKMQAVNPAVVPRNWLLQQAIDAASDGDVSVLNELTAALRDPFSAPANPGLMQKRPAWAENKAGCSMLSCSS